MSTKASLMWTLVVAIVLGSLGKFFMLETLGWPGIVIFVALFSLGFFYVASGKGGPPPNPF